MKYAATICFLFGLSAFAGGCCGPMWQPGGCCGPIAGCDTASGCVGNCGDGCGACEGCGELYIDPWINHPADCCDPCDACGNYNGQSCGKCRSVFTGIKSLWGYRCDDGSCGSGCDGACGGGSTGCGTGDCGCGDGQSSGFITGEDYEIPPGAIIHDGDSTGQHVIQHHTTGPSIQRSYRGNNTEGVARSARQIFTPRSENAPAKSLAY